MNRFEKSILGIYQHECTNFNPQHSPTFRTLSKELSLNEILISKHSEQVDIFLRFSSTGIDFDPGSKTIPKFYVIFLVSIQIVGYSLKLGCDSFIPCVLKCTIRKIFNNSILLTESFDFRGLYLNKQVSDRYGMEFKTRPIYVGFVVE